MFESNMPIVGFVPLLLCYLIVPFKLSGVFLDQRFEADRYFWIILKSEIELYVLI